MLKGQDVSNYQGAYAWPGGLNFGFAKATEGTFYRDASFSHNWSTLAGKKYLRGAYHFGHPGTNAVDQARYYVDFVKSHGLESNDALALDLEVTDGRSAPEVAAWVRSFCGEVKALCGKNVIIYTTASMAGDGSCSGSYNQPLWIADPNGVPGSPGAIGGWKTWTLHQYSWKPVDQDAFNGDGATWDKIVNVHVAPKFPIRDGQSDSEVRQLQELLNKRAEGIGLKAKLQVDGDFGPKTLAAVKLALKAFNYSAAKVDKGECDASLWEHLKKGDFPKSAPKPAKPKPPAKPEPPKPQSGTEARWRWCHKCQGLFYGPNAKQSHCPAGGTHDMTGSYDYSLPWERN